MAASRIRIDGILLTDSLVAMGSPVVSGVQHTFIEITCYNSDTVAHQVDVHFIKTGGAAGLLNQVIGEGSANELKAKETRTYPFQPMMGFGDFIEAKADTTLKVAFSAGILRESV